ncbi:hypothetical protein [Microbispora bryophytorum]|uniref:DUF3800 domain-containing protein n=1 Tax=Microbispora bryophytorum TaxID=1460882 RepID=A0A8H9H3V7_9ACTN|nr:hypothetical protein [Microbispora bryophytorum]MBD3135080.1 hypothetical protein [Microbispora bryophytorum]TQS08691.1 hypothetical protein FLX07_05415 [Microbispora bryophytorum]GGO10755.1 hypothetical protein GCM10011574_27650 [Microbispora bryophytorum]
MLLAYADESLTCDRYSMVALLAPKDQAIFLTRTLDEVVAGAAQAYGVVPPAQLHDMDLSHGNRGWEPIVKTRRVMIGVYHAAFLAIADYEAATGPIPRRPAGDDAA